MANQRLSLTRDQFASFLQDFEQIKQFERLFSTVNSNTNDIIPGVEFAAGNSGQAANDALSQIAALARLVELLYTASDANSGVASLESRLNALAESLEIAPRNELGTMAPLQQADVPWLTFNNAPSPVPTAVGSVYWDGGTTINVQATPNVLIRVGESEYVYAKASSAITKGQLCYHTGAVGSSGTITAAPTPLALSDPNQIVGVAAETIALNSFGLIQISGDLRGFNTTGSSVGETWADGDPLYYNPAYVGSMTKVKPSAPNQKTYIGEVINAGSGGSGSMHIRIVQGSVLGGTDSNVQFGTLANGDLIQYDSTLQYWKNVSAASVIAGGGGVPVTKTADFTVAVGETWIINNKSGSTCTVTLPSAGTYPGRYLTFQNNQDQSLVSASSNVIPQGGGAAGTAILENVSGNWATLVSNGTNWVIMQAASFNNLLY
jgi:hypothetical protein